MKDDSKERTRFPKITSTGTQWKSETFLHRWELRARPKLWLTLLLSEFRFCSRKHAGEIKRFGLCGHDKRGPVVSWDVGLSVQNERLSEHSFSCGRGEATHTFLLFTCSCSMLLLALRSTHCFIYYVMEPYALLLFYYRYLITLVISTLAYKS